MQQNQLRTLPADIQYAHYLTEVDASANTALDVAAFSGQIKNLGIRSLSLNECNLLYLPVEFAALKQLQRLSLSDNYISAISEDYTANPRLSYLDLSNNRIKALPASFAEFTALNYLNLSQNPLLDNTKSYAVLAQLPALHTLVMCSAGALDPVIFSSVSLRQLDISNSTFTKVDIEKGAEFHLEKLIASNCNNFDFNFF